MKLTTSPRSMELWDSCCNFSFRKFHLFLPAFINLHSATDFFFSFSFFFFFPYPPSSSSPSPPSTSSSPFLFATPILPLTTRNCNCNCNYTLHKYKHKCYCSPYTETDEPSRIVSKYQLAARYGRQDNANCAAQYDGCVVNFLDAFHGLINFFF